RDCAAHPAVPRRAGPVLGQHRGGPADPPGWQGHGRMNAAAVEYQRGVGLKAVELGMVVVPDDQDRLADDAGTLDGSPGAAVPGVRAVVAQDVELAGPDAVGMLAACDRRA